MKKIKALKTVNVYLCTIYLMCISPIALAELDVNADVDVRHDSNVNNAQMENDKAAVSILDATISATGHFPFENGNSLSITAESKGEAFDRYNGLNNVSLGAVMAYRKKWALGAYAPWTGLSLSSAHLNFTNNIRNGWRNRIALRGGKRIDERLDVRAEYMVERRSANSLAPDQPGISGDVFSLNSRTIALNAAYTLNESTFLACGALLRRGDVVASTSETTKIISASKAIAVDPVFGPHFYAYRMDGTTYGLNVDLNFEMTLHSLLSASISRQVTHTTGDNNYAKTVQMISWNYNF